MNRQNPSRDPALPCSHTVRFIPSFSVHKTMHTTSPTVPEVVPGGRMPDRPARTYAKKIYQEDTNTPKFGAFLAIKM